MYQTSIFISSTCYDLLSLREHLRTEISSWGHDPILSEYPSFPVAPELSTVENCKKVVKDRADVFVLIIGGKRGSLDPLTNRSVVNSEYIQAKAKGIDCFVFVEKHVWDLRGLYKKNPSMDFSGSVDNVEVFKFIEDIQNDTKWIFPFSRTEEILATLKNQLSVRLQDLLKRFRSNTISIPYEFIGEPDDIAKIARDKEQYWEYRLASTIIKHRLELLGQKFFDLNSGFIVKPLQILPPRETMSYVRARIGDFSSIIQSSVKILEQQLTPAFGPPGVSGDPGQIKRACDNFTHSLTCLYEWELSVRFVQPHEAFAQLFGIMHGWTTELIAEFHRIPTELEKIISMPKPEGEYQINLIIKAPSGMSDLSIEMERLGKDPRTAEIMFSAF